MKTLYNSVAFVLVLFVVSFGSVGCGESDSPTTDSEPTRVDRTPTPEQAPVGPRKEVFQDWSTIRSYAGPDQTGGNFMVLNDNGICTLLVRPPYGYNDRLLSVNFRWPDGSSDTYRWLSHNVEDGEWALRGSVRLYATYEYVPQYRQILSKIRRLRSVSVNGHNLSLMGASDALDAIGC